MERQFPIWYRPDTHEVRTVLPLTSRGPRTTEKQLHRKAT